MYAIFLKMYVFFLRIHISLEFILWGRWKPQMHSQCYTNEYLDINKA